MDSFSAYNKRLRVVGLLKEAFIFSHESEDNSNFSPSNVSLIRPQRRSKVKSHIFLSGNDEERALAFSAKLTC